RFILLFEHRAPRLVRFRDSLGLRRTADFSDHLEVLSFFGVEQRLPWRAAKLIGPGDWVIDAGANVGHITGEMCALVGASGCVWAIEPIPRNVSRLTELQSNNGLNQLHIF